MRVGIYAPNMTTPRPSGVERYVRELVPALAAAESPHEFVLFTDAPWSDTPRARRVPVPPMGLLARLHFDHRRLAMAAHRERLDVLHCVKSSVPAGLGCPAVMTVHDVIFLRHPEYYPFWWRWYWNGALRRSAERAAAIVCVSRTTAGDLEELSEASRGKVHAVPSAVNARFFGTPGPRPGAAPGGAYFLYVGNITARKNVPALLDAFASVRDKVREALVLVGGLDYGGGEVARRLRALGPDGRVKYLDHVPDEELLALYAGATALVYPSRYEGFGLPALEAMAAGCPVIATTGGALPEVVGDAGLLVEPGPAGALAGALERLARDADLRRDLVGRGRARAKEFRWEKTAALTLRVYEGLGKPGRVPLNEAAPRP